MYDPPFCYLVLRILNRSPHLVQAQDANGWTLLHVSAMNENMYFVNDIIKRNPSTVNVQGKGFETCLPFVYQTFRQRPFTDGATALHIACCFGNMNLIEYLLKAGADWAITDDAGWTPGYYIPDESWRSQTPGETTAQIFRRMCEEEGARRNPDNYSTGGKSMDNDDLRGESNAQIEYMVGATEAQVEEPKLIPSRGDKRILNCNLH